MEIKCDRCGRKATDGDAPDKEDMILCDKCVDVLTDMVVKAQNKATEEALEYFMNNECPYRLKRMEE